MIYYEKLLDKFAIAIASQIKWGDYKLDGPGVPQIVQAVYSVAEAFIEEKRRRLANPSPGLYDVPAHAMGTMTFKGEE